MNVGLLFLVIALILFFLAAAGLVIPTLTGIAWGLFSLTLWILLSGVPVPTSLRR